MQLFKSFTCFTDNREQRRLICCQESVDRLYLTLSVSLFLAVLILQLLQRVVFFNIHQSAVACLMSTNTVLMAMSYGILWPEQSIHKMLSPQEFMGHNEKVKYKLINLSSNTNFSAK